MKAGQETTQGNTSQNNARRCDYPSVSVQKSRVTVKAGQETTQGHTSKESSRRCDYPSVSVQQVVLV